ncbi:MAG: DNA-deoxyinosine glycosylase [Clostridiales bacterium]|nr:DNA-deoxyinosine glycosylase [Clostridiales bacterium]
MRFSGFEPVFDGKSKILILGSFPSVISRAENFYYGNKQNRFWGMLSKALGCEKPTTVEEKCELVLKNGIALWDIVTECEIKGSMDADIKDYVVADLYKVINHAPIQKILLNGGKAFEIFARHYPELINIAKKMPSTSSANVRYDQAEWLKEF